MESLKELYRIGVGPSSSHTLAPQKACQLFMEHFDNVLFFDVELFGSLALTGVGHSTDQIIKQTFLPRMCTVTNNLDLKEDYPNGLIIRGYNEYHQLVGEWTVYSLGGGAIKIKEIDFGFDQIVYPHTSMKEILSYCQEKKISLGDYCFEFEDISNYLNDVLSQMLKTVKSGLDKDGMLPGSLKIERVAKRLNIQASMLNDSKEKERLLLMAYSYSAMEENASGQTTVTAPTMGSCGIVASLMYHYYYNVGYSRKQLIKALACGGIFGNLIKKNATISGAVGGCQAEVGTACAMASAIVAYLNGLNNDLIEYSAEIGIEHFLGLTCDPIGGYVMIPCIERNAVAVLRALDNVLIAKSVGSLKENKVSFDDVIKTMNYTGNQIVKELKETSLGGLATEVNIEDEIYSETEDSTFKNQIETIENHSDISLMDEISEPVCKEKMNEIEELESEKTEVEEDSVVDMKQEEELEKKLSLDDYDLSLLSFVSNIKYKEEDDEEVKDAFDDHLDF